MRVTVALARVAVDVSIGIGRVVVALAAALAVLEATRVVDLGGFLWTWPMAFLVLAVTHEWWHVVALFALGGVLDDVCRGPGGHAVSVIAPTGDGAELRVLFGRDRR